MRKFMNGVVIGVLLATLILALPGLATGVKQNISVYFNRINLQVQGEPVAVDNILYNGVTYVPLREVSEMLGKDVLYNNASGTVNITEKAVDDSNYVLGASAVNGVEIGMAKQDLVNAHGLPDRVDPSAYGFIWYVYDNDYNNYIQAGIEDDKIVALYSNTGKWELENSIGIGATKDAVAEKFGNPLPTVTEGNYVYPILKSNDFGLYNYSEQLYAYFFYDIHNNETVVGVMLWNKEIPFKNIFSGNYNDFEAEKWQSGMERQMFDLSNNLRVRMGYTPFVWDDKAARAAYLHSCDMSSERYFDHINKKGVNPFERMKAQNIHYSKAGENLAMGQMNSIFAVHSLINSEGHRKKILGEYQRLGVGVCFNTSRKQTYYTQNFYTP